MNRNNNNLISTSWKYTAFTEEYAYVLAKTMKDKFEVKIITKPYKRPDNLWEFEFTNPFIK